MKTIVILTDFSENATHAAETGVILAEKLHTSLLLFNTYVDVPVIPQYASGPWVVDELLHWEKDGNKKLEQLAQRLDVIINEAPSHSHKPVVNCMLGEGSVGENVVDIIEKKDVELIVMGARSDSNIDTIFTSSDIGSVIKQTTRPVIVVPLGADLRKLKKVVFATDFDDDDMKAIHYLMMMGRLFDFQLDIVHINLYGDKETPKTEQQINFVNQVARLKYPGLGYKEVRGKDVINRLYDLCNETEADLLAMVHYQHSFFTRLVQHSTTKKALSNQKTPLMIFPSKME